LRIKALYQKNDIAVGTWAGSSPLEIEGLVIDILRTKLLGKFNFDPG